MLNRALTSTQLRKRLNLSAEEFAAALGRSQLIVKKYGLQRRWPAELVVQMLQRWPGAISGWELRPDLYTPPNESSSAEADSRPPLEHVA